MAGNPPARFCRGRPDEPVWSLGMGNETPALVEEAEVDPISVQYCFEQQ
jgi:hypothetical protein